MIFSHKRIISLVLALFMCFSVLQVMTIKAYAATTITSSSGVSGSTYSSNYATKLDNIFQGKVSLFSNSSVKYALGSRMDTNQQYTVAGAISGYQCYIYAQGVYYYLFGDIPYHGDGYKYWSNSKKVLTNQGSASYESFRNAGVGFGAYIRTTTNSDGSYNGSGGHSMIVLSYNSSNITYLEGNADGNGLVRISINSWSEFNTKQVSGRSRKICHIVQCNLTGGESCACSTAYAGTYTCTTSNANLTIRSGHGSSYGAIGSIPPGATVTVSKASGTGSSDWAHVTYNGVSGYASMQYLSKEPIHAETPTISWWVSDTEFGDTPSSFKVGNSYYFCVKLYDSVTGKLWNEVSSDNYTLNLTFYNPDGSVKYSSGNVNNQDDYWIRSYFDTPGTYRYGVELTGDYLFSGTRSFVVQEDPKNVHVSSTALSLALDGTKSQSIYAWTSGYYSGSTVLNWATNNDNVTCSWGDWNDERKCPLTITGLTPGTTTVTVSVKDKDSGTILHSVRISVTVSESTRPSASISSTNNLATSQTVTLGMSDTYGIAGYYWGTSSTYSNNTYTSTSSTSITKTISSAGTYYLTAKDKAGNISTTASITFYKIVLDAKGGSVSPAYAIIKSGNSISLPTLTRSGYTFLGWSTSSTATSASYQPGSTFSSNANTTLYAVWKSNATYSITYNANGGLNAPSTQTGSTSYTISSTVPTRFGYTFLGWSASSSATTATYEPGDTIAITGNITLYAVWKSATTLSVGTSYSAKINFSNQEVYYAFTPLSSGTYTFESTGSVDSKIYVYNASGTELDNDDDSSDEGTNFKLTMNLTGVTTYYIKVRAYSSYTGTISFKTTGEYTVTYNANDGSNAPANQTKAHGTTLTLSTAVPIRSGYTFKGWATSSTATSATYQPGGTYTSNGNVTLYAVWQANTYTVRYNANGGSGSMSNSTHTYDTSKVLSANTFTRIGYTFLGWATSSTATSATYSDGQSVKNLTSVNGATVDLYAVWQSNSSALSANSTNSAVISSGGEMKYYTFTPTTSGTYVIYSTGADDTKVYLYNASGSELDSDDDDGDSTNFRLEYDLIAGTQYTYGVKYYNSSKNGTISFKFGNVYTITYNANGGSGVPSAQKKDYGADITLSSTTPTRGGYTFLGWATSSSATAATYQPGDSFASNSNTTLYAVWDLVVATSIAVKTTPAKTTYWIGESLNTAGLTLTATYSDGSTKTVSSGFTTSGFSSTTAGTKTVTVSYEGKTTTFAVTVNTPTVTGIAIKSNPTKTSYWIGESLNTTGLTLTATYSDGSTKTVSNGFTTSGFSSTTAGTKTVTVSYEGKTTTFAVTVNTPTVTGIAIKSNPTKTTYWIGESLNTTGLTLTATYSDGSTKSVSTGFTTSGFSSTTAGTKTVTVTYEGKTATFTVTVNQPTVTGITVKTKPTKTTYWVGESLNTSGLTLTATYSDGSTKTVSTGFTTSDFSSTTAGTKTVTVTYEGKTATFTVTVNTPTVTGIEIATNPTKVTYWVDENLDTSGLSLVVRLSDGTTQTVSSGFTVSGFDSTTAGEKIITVSYKGESATFAVQVNEPTVASIEVRTYPTKTEYLTGEALDITGLMLTAVYSDGTTMRVGAGFTVSGFDSNTAGTKTVIVTYEGKTVTFTVEVVAPVTNGITKQPEAVTTETGTDVQFKVVATGDVVSYKWEYRKIYKWYSTSMEGYNTDTLTVPATGARNGYDYRCIVTFADGTQLISEPAELTVNTYITDVQNPNDQTVVLGYKGQFTASAQGEGLKYQWQYQRPGSEAWIDTAMEGATKPTVLIETTTARNGYKYRCVITDVTGKTVYTEPATMRVLSFKSHPQESFSVTGANVTFSVTTSVAEGFTYQWQYSKNGVTWTNTTMPGYNTATLTVSATKARNGYQYRCVLTGSKNSKIESKSAVLHVGDPIAVTAQPEGYVGSVGQTAVFEVEASNVYTYRWQYARAGSETWNNTTMEGADTASLKVQITAGRNGYRYRCVMVGFDGREVISQPAKLTVK